MTPLDRELALLINGLVGSSRVLFELVLFLCGSLPLVACVAVMLALWWTDLEGGGGEASPALGLGPAPAREGVVASRRRCVALAACTAGAFVATRLVAFGTELPRPLGREALVVPLPEERWRYTVDAMTGFGAFPSDHAALFMAIGVGLLAWSRRWGIAAIVVAGLLSLGRVAVGFHYPSDMLAGAAIGAAFGMLSIRLGRAPGELIRGAVALFDRHPAVMYPLLFVLALDFTQHFRVVMRAVFYLLLTLVGR